MTQPIEDPVKGTMAAKSSILPVILAAIISGSVAFILGQLQFSLWLEPDAPPDAAPPVIEIDPAPPSPAVTPTRKTPLAKTVLPNGFRVSNRSPFAVRVVLLSQKIPSPSSDIHRDPIHWDFAPQEGSQDGLLLSLPEGSLKLSAGDVVVAFALDGSQRYWGPYIVGTSAQPTQIKPDAEWQLTLTP
jgi:hypothetical protein